MVDSLPQDFDRIIQVVNDALGEKRLIATPLLARFHEDLVDAIGSLENDGGSETLSSLMARISEIENQISDNPFTMDTTGFTMDTTSITTDMSKA